MKKGLIILITIITLYVLIVIFGFEMLDSNKNIYIGTEVKWSYKNSKWQKEDIEKDLLLKKYNVYDADTHKYIGKYNLKKVDNNLYLENKNNYELNENNIIFFKGNKIKLYDFKQEYEIESNVIKEILRKVNISEYGELNLMEKTTIDIDNDGNDEIIYAISNVYSSMNERNHFSIVALYKNNQYQIIKSNIDSGDSLLYVYAIVDLNSDNQLELILIDEGFSLSGNTYYMYELKNNDYIEVR